jgi:hypothetical protein
MNFKFGIQAFIVGFLFFIVPLFTNNVKAARIFPSVFYFSNNANADSSTLAKELVEMLCQEKCFIPNDLRIYHYINDDERSSKISISRISKKIQCNYFIKDALKIVSSNGCETSLEAELIKIKNNKQAVVKDLDVKLIWISDKAAPNAADIEVFPMKGDADFIDIHDMVNGLLSGNLSRQTLLMIFRDDATNSVQKPQVAFSSNSLTIDYGDSIQLNPNIRGGMKTIEWTPQMYLSCVDCLKPWVSPDESMEYSVKVTNEFGCVSNETKINLFVKDPCEPESKSLKIHISEFIGIIDSVTHNKIQVKNETCYRDNQKSKNRWTLRSHKKGYTYHLVVDNTCAQCYDLEIWSIDTLGNFVNKLLTYTYNLQDVDSRARTSKHKLYLGKLIFSIIGNTQKQINVIHPEYKNNGGIGDNVNPYYKIKLISYRRCSDRDKGLIMDFDETPEVRFQKCEGKED